MAEDDGAPAVLFALTVKVVLVAVPPPLLTVIEPVVAPAGTIAVSLVVLTKVDVAVVPLNLTVDGLVKFVPLIVIVEPMHPFVGLKLVIVGAGGVKLMTHRGGLVPG